MVRVLGQRHLNGSLFGGCVRGSPPKCRWRGDQELKAALDELRLEILIPLKNNIVVTAGQLIT